MPTFEQLGEDGKPTGERLTPEAGGYDEARLTDNTTRWRIVDDAALTTPPLAASASKAAHLEAAVAAGVVAPDVAPDVWTIAELRDLLGY